MPETGHLVRYKIFVLLFFLCFFNSGLLAQVYPDSGVHSSLTNGIDLIIKQKYKSAEGEFARLCKANPSMPLWNLYYAAAKLAEAYDYGYDYESKEIEFHLNEALHKSEVLLEKESENIWYIYFYALSKGYLAYYNGLNSNWFSTAKYGLSSIDSFEKCISKDSSFFDAYVGIGVFKYWKSRKSEFLSWLPFVSNEKSKGINYLLKAQKHNSYNSYIAAYNLIWILIEEGKNEEAVKTALKALRQYPDTRLFKWGYARACEKTDVNKAIEAYTEILNSLQNEGVKNKYKEVILKYTLARNYKKIGDKKRALQLCDEILQINNMDSRIKNRLEDRIKKVKELKKELSN